MLAYLFWHRPRAKVSVAEYEERLLAFHAALRDAGVRSATFHLATLPFATRGGYEDWYLIDDWAALGDLGEVAISGSEGARHESVAQLSGQGWGGVYALLRGAPHPPTGARWVERTHGGVDARAVGEHRDALAVWRRQLVLGPAPELCLAEEVSPGREQLSPS